MAAISGPEIEQLIHRFSQPGSAHEIKEIENRVRELQLSPQGWEIGDYLLGHDDPTFQFFGAVTFRIKLGTGISELDDITLSQITHRLLGWLVTSIDRGDASPVLRKLCGNLAYICTLDRDVGAENIVRRVLYSFAHGQVVDSTTADLTLEGISALSGSKLKVAAWFLTALIEESNKESTTKDARQSAVLASRVAANLPAASSFLMYCFSQAKVAQGSQDDYQLQVEAAFAAAVWIFYAREQRWIHQDHLITPLRHVMNSILDWLELSELDVAADQVAEVLSDFPGFFTPAQMNKIAAIITGPWATKCLQELLADPVDERPCFVHLLLAYTDSFLTRMVEHPGDPITVNIMAAMHVLVNVPGFPGVDDIVSIESLEFWTQFVEHIADAEFEDPDEEKPWLPAANAHTMQLVHELWRKIKLPTPEQLKELDTDRTKEFRQFRVDVKELLLAAFPALRTQLTELIARLCLQALERRDWLEVEASLFCLNAISIAEQESEDEILSQLFGSTLFVQLKEDDSVPARARATSVDVLGQYAEYFERHTEFLPAVLDFLFSSLHTQALAQKSAKAINRLSSSCRGSLVQQLPNFVQAYEQFLSWPTAEVSTKEKVIGGVAAIAQALPSSEDQASSLAMLLGFVEQDFRLAQHEWSNNRGEEAQVASLNALRCLASIGKACQATNDEPLEGAEESTIQQFWSTGSGHAVQVQIFSTIRNVLDMYNSSSEVLELHGDAIEAVCSVFRAGFTESKPGPFVFSASSFVDFFSTMQLHTPRLEVVLTTTCSFLRSHSHASSPDVMQEATRLLGEIYRLISSIHDIRSEDNTTGLLDILERFMPRYTSVFYALPQAELETLFGFTIECLAIPEPLPKRAAASFWTAFIALAPGRSKVTQEHLDEVINHFGPRLAIAFMRNVAGGAVRTDLEWFADPLKKFTTRTVHAKRLLEEALMAIDAGSAVNTSVKAKFLKQLTVAHGSGTVKKVVTSFWSQCRGIDASYAP